MTDEQSGKKVSFRKEKASEWLAIRDKGYYVKGEGSQPSGQGNGVPFRKGKAF